MTILREAAQQALEAMEYNRLDVGKFNRINAACQALRAALAQQAEPVASGCRVMVCGVDCHPGDQHCNGYCTGKTDDPPEATAEQKKAFAWLQNRERPSCDECGKSKVDGWALYCVECSEKVFTAPPQQAEPVQEQDAKLSAALGWPGGISNPALDRTQLLQMVAALRLVAQQALEALEGKRFTACGWKTDCDKAVTALRAALAQQAEPLNLSDPAVQKRLAAQWGYVHEAQQAKPVEPVAWECKAGGLKPLTQRQYDAQTAATKRHYTRIAPPQRQPLTEEEIEHICMTHQSLRQVARAVEKAVWEKNNGQA